MGWFVPSPWGQRKRQERIFGAVGGMKKCQVGGRAKGCGKEGERRKWEVTFAQHTNGKERDLTAIERQVF